MELINININININMLYVTITCKIVICYEKLPELWFSALLILNI